MTDVLDDEEDEGADVDAVELIDLRRPIRREIAARAPEHLSSPRHLSVVELRLAETRLGVSTFASSVRGLIVGQNPGRHTHPDLPLFPWPSTSSAGRLVAMSDLTPGEYLGGLYRRNLVDDHEWSDECAALRARSIVTTLFEMPRSLAVVLCGHRVRDAFEVRAEFWEPVKLDSRQICVVIPHPSGLNHVYNDESARARTREWMRWAALGERMPR